MPTLLTRTQKTDPVGTDQIYLAQSPFGATDDRRATLSNVSKGLDVANISNATSNAAVITDNRIVRGDGGANGVQESTGSIDDSGNLTGVQYILNTTTSSDPAANAATSTSNIDNFDGVIITTTTTGNAQTLQTPTTTANRKEFLVGLSAASTDSVTVNSHTIDPGEYVVFAWDGTSWLDSTSTGLTQGGVFTASATASQTIFNVGFDLPSSKSLIAVFAGGARITEDQYERTGAQQITFDTGLEASTPVMIMIPGAITVNLTGDSVTQNQIPLKGATEFIDSPISFDSGTNTLTSTADLVLPGPTLFISQNVALSSSGNALRIRDVAGATEGFVVQYDYTTSGSTRPFYRKLAAIGDGQQQLTDSSDSGSTTNQFVITGTADLLLTQLTLKSATTGLASFTVRRTSHTGEFILENEQIPLMTANVETDIPLNSPFFIENGVDYYITVNDVRLLGTGTLGVDFQPFYRTRGHSWNSVSALTNDEIDNASNATGLLTAAEIDRRIGNGGGSPTTLTYTLYHGLSDSNNPASVDTGTLNAVTETNTTTTATVSTGTTTAGQYYIILVPVVHDITQIRDTVLDQDVTSLFTKTTNVRTISSQQYNSFVIGPLNAGVSESYVLTLTTS